jgi:DNA-binding transcriptional LysR family regulator
MANPLNLSRIAYFYEAARLGSIRAAADLLNVAPSAVTRQVQLLEAELGTALLERQGRGVAVTDAGLQVLEFHREQEAHVADLQARLQSLREMRSGRVGVVLGEGFIADILAGPLGRFCREHPGIKLSLDSAGTNELIRKVLEDEAEIGLVYNPPSHPKLVSRCIRKQPMKVIFGADSPLREAQGPLKARELLGYPLAVTYPTHGVRQLLDVLAFAEKVHFDPVMTTNSIATLKQFAKSGLGIAFLPAFAITSELESGEIFCRDVDHPLFLDAEAHLITRAGRRLSMAATKMLQVLTSQMQAFR